MPSRTSFWVVPRKRVHLHVGTDPIWQHRPHSYAWGSFNTWIWKARRVQKQTKFWWWGCSEPGQRAFSPPILYLCGWGSGRPTPLGGLKLLSSCCCIKITFSLWFACGLTLLGKKILLWVLGAECTCWAIFKRMLRHIWVFSCIFPFYVCQRWPLRFLAAELSS